MKQLITRCSSTITRMLLILMLLVTGSASAWGDSYELVFATGSNDGTAASTSTAVSTILSSGSEYVTGNIATATKVYYNGSNGLKLGTSSAAGVVKINLSNKGQVTPTSIDVYALFYNSSKTPTLKVNGSDTKTISTGSSTKYTFSITSQITYIELTSNKYCWVQKVVVNYNGESAKSAPTFTAQPTGASYNQNATATSLTVAANGNPTPTYQWYSNTTNSNENGTIITGETNTTYTPSTTTAGTFYYYCVATNSEGSAKSNVATITVNALVAPSFTTQPKGAEYIQNATATALSVVASGNPAPTYQWYSNSSNSTECATAIDGATNASYTPSTATVGTTYYYCVATNSMQSTTSNIVAVVVNPIPTYAAKFWSNGSVYSTADYQEGQAVTFPATDPTAPNNDVVFIGWSENTIDGTTDTKPTLVSSATMGNSIKNFYAVFAKEEGSSGYKLVSSLTEGKKYVFATRNTAGDGYALASTVTTGTSVVIAASGDDKIISGTPTKNIVWTRGAKYGTISGSFDLQNVGTSTVHLKINGSSVTTADAAYPTFWDSSKGLYGKSNTGTGSTSYYLLNSNGTFSKGTGSTTNRVYAYEEFASYSAYCTTVVAKTETTTSFGETKTFTVYTDDSFKAPTATVTGAENASVTYESSNTDVATVNASTGEVTLVGVGTTTITAKYAGDATHTKSQDSYTLTVYQAYASIQALQGNTSTTAVDMKVTLTNVYVNGVNGNYAYINDGTYGAVINTENHGLTAGKKINGVLKAKVLLKNGQTQITEFSATGLTITDEAATAAVVTDLSTIKSVNVGKLVTLKDVKFDGTKFVKGEASITPYNSLNIENYSFIENATYDVTGIVVVYNTTIEIAPRSASDIVKLDTRTAPTNKWMMGENEVIEFTVDKSQEWTAPTFSTNSTGAITYSSSNEDVATINASTAEITLKAVGETNITASVAETENYLAASLSYKLKVRESATLPFTFDGGKSDLASKAGHVSSQLGTDYSSSPKLKFATEGDYLIINYGSAADKIRYTVKGNQTNSKWEGQFDVMESANGTDYTTVHSYTEMGTDAKVETYSLNEASRYVKFVFTSRTNGNVALGNITIKHSAQLATASNLKAETNKKTATLTWDAVENASSYEVKYKTTSAQEWTTVSPAPTTNSCSLTNLANSTTYNWSVKAIGDGFNYADGVVANGGNFSTAAPVLYTVTFKDRDNADVVLTETAEGAGITPPSISAVGDYTFAGWATSKVTEETTTAPEFVTLTDGKYYPTAATTLYSVYSTKKDGNKYGVILSTMVGENRTYLAARSGTNKYFGTTTEKASAQTLYIDGGHIYYLSGNTKYYFYNVSSADLTFQTSKAEQNLWTVTTIDGVTTVYNATTSRYLAYNSRFAAYLDNASFPHDLLMERSSNYITDKIDYFISIPSVEVTPIVAFSTKSASIKTVDAEGKKNTYKNETLSVGGSTGVVTYTSSDEAIATVASDGTVSVVKGGNVTITANVAAVAGTWKAASAAYTLTINKETPTIAFDANQPTQVYVANTITVHATSSSNGTVYYYDNSDKLDINEETGVITGNAVTSGVNVYAYVDETDLYTAKNTTSTGAKLSIKVVSNAKTQTLSFAETSYEFSNGQTVENFTNELSGAKTAVTYASDNTAIAEVNQTTGEVTVHTNVGGIATITAKAAANDNVVEDGIRYNYGQATKTYTITVNYPKPTFSLAEGEYHSDQLLVLSASGAQYIYYTTDGAAPTFDGENGTGTEQDLSNGNAIVALEKGTTTVKAIAVYADNDLNFYASSVASATYTLVAPAAPTASFEDGATVKQGTVITLSSSEGTTITYSVYDDNEFLIEETTTSTNLATFSPSKGGVYTVEFKATWNEEDGYSCDAVKYTLKVNGPAPVPYSYNGNGSNLPIYFTKTSGVGNYDNAETTKIKLDKAGYSVVLWYGAEANTLSFDAMLNGTNSNDNVFVVSTSTDGNTWTALHTFTGEDGKLIGTATTYSYALPSDARYIKWEYETKSSGNVGLGNIRLATVTNQSLSFVAYNTKNDVNTYWTTFSNENVTFFPKDGADVCGVMINDAKNGLKLTANSNLLGAAQTIQISGNNVTGYLVPANTGVLVKNSSTSTTYYVVNGMQVSALTGNQLYPASKPMSDFGEEYQFFKLAYYDYENKEGLGFYWGADDGAAFTAKAGGAYLALTATDFTGAPLGISGLRFSLDDMEEGNETSIQNVNVNIYSDGIFTLEGKRLDIEESDLPKGIYLVNGKKIVKF